jgi:hypothetical protein
MLQAILRKLEKWSTAQWHQSIFVKGLYLSYFLFAAALTGIVHLDPQYLDTLETALHYYVCFFLIIRFNPLSRNRAMTPKTIEFDRRIAFSAGVFLLLTTALTQAVMDYVKPITTKVAHVVSSV